jgi:hypothetical protein
MVMVWSSFTKEVVQERYNAYGTCRDEDDPESFSSRHVASWRERDLSMLRHRIEMLYSDENYVCLHIYKIHCDGAKSHSNRKLWS